MNREQAVAYLKEKARYFEKQALKCECVVKNRESGESQRDWFKRWMCMLHWMQTDYYREKGK